MTQEPNPCGECKAMLLCVTDAITYPLHCEGCSWGEVTALTGVETVHDSTTHYLTPVRVPPTCPKMMHDANHYFCQKCWKDGTADNYQVKDNTRQVNYVRRRVGAEEVEGWRIREKNATKRIKNRKG